MATHARTKARGVLIAGNWKMNHGKAETAGFFEKLPRLPLEDKPGAASGLRVCLFPPALSLGTAIESARARAFNAFEFGAQNVHWEAKGAYTGELSAPMILEAGGTWALVGHSERRQHFAETDENVGRRAQGALSQGLNVMLCIGETRAEREGAATAAVIARQLLGALVPFANYPYKQGFSDMLKARKLVIAYEPVWAIGTGLTATPEQAEEAHVFVRNELAQHFGAEIAAQSQILYGGSVTPDNIATLLTCENIDGALVGGASLKPEGFAALILAGKSAL